MTVVRHIMQISKPVKFSRRPDTGSQQYSKRNSSFELRLDGKLKIPFYKIFKTVRAFSLVDRHV